MRAYRLAVLVFAVLFVALGLAMIGVTAAAGGGGVGFVLGSLFVVLGVARISVERRRTGDR